MSITVKRFRRASPQPWKPKGLELADRIDDRDDPTVEYFITDDEGFMDIDDEITQVFKYEAALISEEVGDA
ncbi:MAG: hypothetical protein AMS22_13075 [Thiotrichales bacterium SG8_50]|nr:MAG: hypothetical protein AMS22_13075 [Thiotrichales bacterium SG8_50]